MANISVVLTIDNQKYIADLKRAEDATKSFADTTKKAGDDAATNLNKAGAAASGLNVGLGKLNGTITTAAFLGFAKSALAFGDSIQDLSNSTGLATKQIMAFREAVTVSGGNIEGAAKGLQYLMLQLDGAREGTAKSQIAFQEVGISLSDLGKLSEKQIFENTLKGLAKLREDGVNTSKIIAIQNELLGKSFKGVTIDAEFITRLDEGKIKYESMSESVKRASDLNDQLQLSLGKLQGAFLVAFTPIIKLLGDLAEIISKSKLAVELLSVALLAIPGMFLARQLVTAFAFITRGLLNISGAAAGAGSAIRALSGNSLGRLKDLGGAVGGLGAAGLGAAAQISETNPAGQELGFGPGMRAPITAADYEAIAKKRADAAKAAGQAVADANQQEAASSAEVIYAYKAKAQAIANATLEFQRSAAQTTNNIKLETFLIGKSKDFADTMRAQSDMVNKTEAEILKLQNAKAALTEEEKKAQDVNGKTLVDVYDAQIAKLKQVGEAEKQRIAIAIEARNKAENSEKLRLFGLQASYDSQRRVNDLQAQAASTLYPELQKRIDAVTKTIYDNADAEVRAEEVRRNTILTEAERSAIREKAMVGLQAEVKATQELYQAEQKRELILFSMKQRIGLENDLMKIQDDMAKMTMPELQRKYYDIETAARDSAKAQIDAAQQAGRALSPEEQKAYYDAAAAGVEKLKRATKESYETSRSFGTGWKKAFNDYIENATNAAKTAENLFNKAMGGIEDSLVNFVKTGKFEWKSFVSSMAEELLRSQIRETFASIMTGMQSGGGILGSIGSLFGLGSTSQAGAQRGQNAAQPLYVLDVSSSGVGAAAAMPGASSMLGGLGSMFQNYGYDPLGPTAGQDITRQISGGGIGGGGGGFFGGIADAASSVFDSIGSFFGGGSSSGGGDSGGGLSDLFDGLFASGGTIGAGRFGIAGEAGPELIGGPATVMPLGGGGNVTYNINAVDASSFKALVAQDPGFIHAIVMQGAKSMPGSRR